MAIAAVAHDDPTPIWVFVISGAVVTVVVLLGLDALGFTSWLSAVIAALTAWASLGAVSWRCRAARRR